MLFSSFLSASATAIRFLLHNSYVLYYIYCHYLFRFLHYVVFIFCSLIQMCTIMSPATNHHSILPSPQTLTKNKAINVTKNSNGIALSSSAKSDKTIDQLSSSHRLPSINSNTSSHSANSFDSAIV